MAIKGLRLKKRDCRVMTILLLKLNNKWDFREAKAANL